MQRTPGFLAITTMVALLVVFMGAVFIYGEFGTSIRSEETVTIHVRPGETLQQFSLRLAEKGVLANPMHFIALGILRGDSGRIKAGSYAVDGGYAPNDLLNALVSGTPSYEVFTIPEGYSIREVAGKLERMGLGNGKRFQELCVDREFIASLKLPFHQPPDTLEGLIFPDTYHLQKGLDEKRLIATLVGAFRRKVEPVLMQADPTVKLAPYEILILASIIEKETGVAQERPLISAVFHNRLNASMRLGSDPTVIYGLEDFDGNLTRRHLRTETPYNTYKIQGLPPTPIANPGLESVLAAISPAEVDFLFFVAKGDGTHHFSKDFNSHKRAVWKYQIRPHLKRRS